MPGGVGGAVRIPDRPYPDLRKRQQLLHSCRSLVIREGQVLAGSRRSGTPLMLGFLCLENGNYLTIAAIQVEAIRVN